MWFECICKVTLLKWCVCNSFPFSLKTRKGSLIYNIYNINRNSSKNDRCKRIIRF